MEEHAPLWDGEKSFHAQHSAPGAFLSFTLGRFGAPGGLGAERNGPAQQDVYVGAGPADGAKRFFPFFTGAGDAEARRYDVESAEAGGSDRLAVFGDEEIARRYGLGTDAWEAPGLRLALYNGFEPIPDPETARPAALAHAIAPVVTGELTLDNTEGDAAAEAVFGLRFDLQGTQPMARGGAGGWRGFATRGRIGFAGQVVDDAGRACEPPETACAMDPATALADPPRVHALGSLALLRMPVPAGARRTLRLALGAFVDGDATAGRAGRYLYRRFFGDIASVLDHGLARFEDTRSRARAHDRALVASALSPARRFLLAHATRSYFGSSQLLEVGGEPYWVVNEGAYVMLNTLDLAVDHVFFELAQNPWVVRNLLDGFVSGYSYYDDVVDPATGDHHPGGIAFAHDQGVANQFSPPGHSSYELPGENGCFSYMSCEQVCNWTLIAASYYAATGDRGWLRAREPILHACRESLERRDHPDPAARNGVMGLDGARCAGGREITTYDSLDESLAQARENLYLAVKGWASRLGLALCFGALGDREAERAALAAAERSAATVAAKRGASGWIPAVFDPESPGHQSRILPAAEGLVYPLYWRSQPHGGAASAWLEEEGPFGRLIAAIRAHTETLLAAEPGSEGSNRFADGGIRLSSTSNNTWISKIALFQHVARELFGIDLADADEAHARWETTGTAAGMAMCDQMVSGDAHGSLYYPRCVTNWLWRDAPRLD